MSNHLIQFGDFRLSRPLTQLTKKQWSAISEQITAYVCATRLLREQYDNCYKWWINNSDYGKALNKLAEDSDGYPELEVPHQSDDPVVEDVISQRRRLLQALTKELKEAKEQRELPDRMLAESMADYEVDLEVELYSREQERLELEKRKAKRQTRMKAQAKALAEFKKKNSKEKRINLR